MTASSTSPLPSGTDYVAATRQSCDAVASSLNLTPNLPAIDSFLLNLDQPTFARLRTQHGLSFPLRFPTPTAELNFLSLLALLNAYSGYRTAFHKATGMGAYQNVVRLMMGLYIAGGEEDKVVGAKSLTSKGLAGVGEGKVVELLGVSVHEEKEHETLKGVMVGVRGGEMLECVQLIVATLNGVGKTLIEKGFGSLGAFVAGLLTQVKKDNLDDVAATDFLTRQIATTLPEFRDTHTITTSNTDVYLFKRIFFLLHSLHLRFPNHPNWAVPNTYTTLPMFVDNVLPTLCVWFHFLTLPPTPTPGMHGLYEWIRTHHCNELTRDRLEAMQKNVAGPRLTVDETYAVRAATLHVGKVVVERAKELAKEAGGKAWLAGMNEVDLDGYLWAVAKDDGLLRKVPRFVFPSIHF